MLVGCHRTLGGLKLGAEWLEELEHKCTGCIRPIVWHYGTWFGLLRLQQAAVYGYILACAISYSHKKHVFCTAT